MTEPQILTSVTLTGVSYLVKNVYKQGAHRYCKAPRTMARTQQRSSKRILTSLAMLISLLLYLHRPSTNQLVGRVASGSNLLRPHLSLMFSEVLHNLLPVPTNMQHRNDLILLITFRCSWAGSLWPLSSQLYNI